METQDFWLGVGQAWLRIRKSEFKKEQRRLSESFSTKLRNRGFSVTVSIHEENVRQLKLAFSFMGSDRAKVTEAFSSIRPLFLGDFELLGFGWKLIEDLELPFEPVELPAELIYKYDEDE